VDVVGRAGKEFCVLPNYSYVSAGTSFFIPIHGSASECATLGETIEEVLLFDPVSEHFIAARPSDAAFQHYMYNLQADVLLLRLRFRVRDKSLYFVKRTKVESPAALEIISALQDPAASNVEIRKSRARDRVVDIYSYYAQPPEGAEAVLFPKDSIGRLWDKLEANAVSSALFHGLMRRFGYHVELFFTANEFAIFWETHVSQPISKIQLRYIRRDGMPNSPFGQHDCVSADLFMLRRHRRTFEAYVKRTFRDVQFNPGKHSA
jgi:hypothetical protein